MRVLFGLISGLVFGLGLIISEMTNPAKVIGFLDVLDGWDPSLAFVMASGVLVFGVGYALFKGRTTSLLGAPVTLPTGRLIDAPLVVGSALFGLGWGLVGFCPGPAIAALTIGGIPAYTFVIAMILGMLLHRAYEAYQGSRLLLSK